MSRYGLPRSSSSRVSVGFARSSGAELFSLTEHPRGTSNMLVMKLDVRQRFNCEVIYKLAVNLLS